METVLVDLEPKLSSTVTLEPLVPGKGKKREELAKPGTTVEIGESRCRLLGARCTSELAPCPALQLLRSNCNDWGLGSTQAYRSFSQGIM